MSSSIRFRSASSSYADPSGRRSLLDVKGTAGYLGTSERHVRRLVEKRRIPFIKLGPGRSARLRFDTDKLDAWIEAHSFEPEAGA